MGNVLLYLAVLPSVVLGFYIYKKDKMDKEPGGLLFKLFAFGILTAISVIAFSLIVTAVFPILATENSTSYFELFIATFFGVALIEESFKLLYLKINTWNNKEFDHIFDAIVYAVFVSLGFATIENILYVFDGGLYVALMRAVLSVPGHFFFAIFMGYYYGLSKQAQINGDKNTMTLNAILSLLVPMLLHGIFDFLLFIGNTYTIIIYFIFVVSLYILSFIKVKQVSSVIDNMKGVYCMYCGTLSKSNYCPRCGNKIVK